MADYTFLVNDIKEACENEGTEFLDYIPKMVNRAEERLTKDLDDYGLVSYTSVAVGSRIVTLPTGTRIVKNINITAMEPELICFKEQMNLLMTIGL